MWLLPLDLSRARIPLRLPEGRHLVPGYYTPGEVDRLVMVLRALLPDVRYHVHVSTRDVLSALRHRPLASEEHTLVTVSIRDAELTAVEREQVLSRLTCRWLLVQQGDDDPPGDASDAWLQVHLLPVLRGVLQRGVADEAHPLAAFEVRHLPIQLAASLTRDGMEFVELLDKALHHRMRYAANGLTEADYRQSLFVTAGRRLRERLRQVPLREMALALEVLLAGGALADRERQRGGGLALQRVGLATCVRGDVALGPLARKGLDHPPVLGAMTEDLPRVAWTKEARRLHAALRERISGEIPRGALEAMLPARAVPRSEPPMLVPVPVPVEAASGTSPEQDQWREAMAALEPLVLARSNFDEVRAAAARAAAMVMARRLAAAPPGQTPAARAFAEWTQSIFDYWLAEGETQLSVMRATIAAAAEKVVSLHPTFTEEARRILAAIRIHLAVTLTFQAQKGALEEAQQLLKRVASDHAAHTSPGLAARRILAANQRGREDLAGAELWLRACLVRGGATGVDRGRIQLQLGKLFLRKGDIAAARLWSLRAQRHFSGDYAADRSRAFYQLAEIEIAQGRREEAFHAYQKSLAIAVADDLEQEQAAAHLALGSMFAGQKSLSPARIHIAEAVRVLAGQELSIEGRSLLIDAHQALGDLDASMGQDDEALRQYRCAILKAREVTGVPRHFMLSVQARCLGKIAEVAQRRGAYDEAIEATLDEAGYWDELKQPMLAAQGYVKLGMLALLQGDRDRAEVWFNEFLQRSQALDDRAIAHCFLAALAAYRSAYEDAVEHCAAAAQLGQNLQHRTRMQETIAAIARWGVQRDWKEMEEETVRQVGVISRTAPSQEATNLLSLLWLLGLAQGRSVPGGGAP